MSNEEELTAKIAELEEEVDSLQVLVETLGADADATSAALVEARRIVAGFRRLVPTMFEMNGDLIEALADCMGQDYLGKVSVAHAESALLLVSLGCKVEFLPEEVEG